MTQAGSLAPSRTTPSRVSRRRRTTRPLSSRPATLQLFLPRSIPRTVIVRLPLLSSTVTVSLAPTTEVGGPSHKTVLPPEQTRPDIARKRARSDIHQGRLGPG